MNKDQAKAMLAFIADLYQLIQAPDPMPEVVMDLPAPATGPAEAPLLRGGEFEPEMAQ